MGGNGELYRFQVKARDVDENSVYVEYGKRFVHKYLTVLLVFSIQLITTGL
jgi:hypothetical protein